jgi:hypothetical protein
MTKDVEKKLELRKLIKSRKFKNPSMFNKVGTLTRPSKL